jgi:hypothetical protein
MELNLTKEKKQIITVFIMIILPLILIGTGILYDIKIAWYFILSIVWFAMGVIFYAAIS